MRRGERMMRGRREDDEREEHERERSTRGRGARDGKQRSKQPIGYIDLPQSWQTLHPARFSDLHCLQTFFTTFCNIRFD